MRIESQIDVITNSSTEVFIAYSDCDIKSLRTIVSKFIDLIGLPKEANEYITIKRKEMSPFGDYGGTLRDDESDNYVVEFKHSRYDEKLSQLMDLLREWEYAGEMRAYYC